MIPDCSGVDPAGEIYQDAFATGRADIYTENSVAHYVLTARGPWHAPGEGAGLTLIAQGRQSARRALIMTIILP
jgi:hypothetical protein